MINPENNGTVNGRDANGRFLPGNAGKPKGASKNKIRDKIKDFINSNFDKLPEYFNGLKPKEKIEILIALMPYAVSRLQSVTLKENESNSEKAFIDYSALSENTLKEILNNTYVDENNLGKS